MPSSSYLYRYLHINFSKYNDKGSFWSHIFVNTCHIEWMNEISVHWIGTILDATFFVNACYIELFEPSSIYMPWNLIDFILNLMLAKYYLIRRHWRGYSWYQTKIISCCSRSNNINWHFIKSFWLSIKHRHTYGKQTRVSQNLFVCRKYLFVMKKGNMIKMVLKSTYTYWGLMFPLHKSY